MTFPPFLLASTCCPRIARVASSEELGTMSKSNLRRITLARGPIWGIHSLTLIISCYNLSLLHLTCYYILNLRTSGNLRKLTRAHWEIRQKLNLRRIFPYSNVRYRQSYITNNTLPHLTILRTFLTITRDIEGLPRKGEAYAPWSLKMIP